MACSSNPHKVVSWLRWGGMGLAGGWGSVPMFALLNIKSTNADFCETHICENHATVCFSIVICHMSHFTNTYSGFAYKLAAMAVPTHKDPEYNTQLKLLDVDCKTLIDRLSQNKPLFRTRNLL